MRRARRAGSNRVHRGRHLRRCAHAGARRPRRGRRPGARRRCASRRRIRASSASRCRPDRRAAPRRAHRRSLEDPARHDAGPRSRLAHRGRRLMTVRPAGTDVRTRRRRRDLTLSAAGRRRAGQFHFPLLARRARTPAPRTSSESLLSTSGSLWGWTRSTTRRPGTGRLAVRVRRRRVDARRLRIVIRLLTGPTACSSSGRRCASSPTGSSAETTETTSCHGPSPHDRRERAVSGAGWRSRAWGSTRSDASTTGP